MSSTTSDLSFAPAPMSYPLRRFSVAEYEQLGRLGILTEDDNVELLEGLVVKKMTKNPPHDGTIDLLLHLLTRMLPNGWIVRVQNVVLTADSAPEPDLAVVRGQPGDFRPRHPEAAEVALIIEVAETSVQRDRSKAAIYARAAIPHYWIVNLAQGQVEVHSLPQGTGLAAAYQARQVVQDGLLTVWLGSAAAGQIPARDILQ